MLRRSLSSPRLQIESLEVRCNLSAMDPFAGAHAPPAAEIAQAAPVEQPVSLNAFAGQTVRILVEAADASAVGAGVSAEGRLARIDFVEPAGASAVGAGLDVLIAETDRDRVDDSRDGKVVYVGTANGGVWKTAEATTLGTASGDDDPAAVCPGSPVYKLHTLRHTSVDNEPAAGVIHLTPYGGFTGGVSVAAASRPTWSSADDVIVDGRIITGENFSMLAGPKGRLQIATLTSVAIDPVFGDLGNDWIVGATGQDGQIGGHGRDLLVGGAGQDLLIGGLGADRAMLDDNSHGTHVAGTIGAIGNNTAAASPGPRVRVFVCPTDPLIAGESLAASSNLAAPDDSSEAGTLIPVRIKHNV